MLRIDRSVASWGKHIIHRGSPDLTEFDLFYLFFWVGLSLGKTESTKNIEKKDIGSGKNYTAPYRHLREMLATVLIMSESKESGFKTKGQITKSIEEYMDVESPTILSQKGEDLMMSYVQSGFSEMKKIMPPSPKDASNFVFMAYKKIEEGFEGNKKWEDAL